MVAVSLPHTENDSLAIMKTVNDKQRDLTFRKQTNINGFRVSPSMGHNANKLDLSDLQKYRVNSMATFYTSGLSNRVSLKLDFSYYIPFLKFLPSSA